MKQKLKNFLSSFPLVSRVLHGQAIILMLHRIAPINPQGLPENENMKIDPRNLESFIISAKKEGYRFISLEELYNNLQTSTFKDNKNLVITIDDGYKDNYTYGFEIFTRHNIPFCIYLCTHFLSTPNMWWFSLEDFILKHEIINLPLIAQLSPKQNINSIPKKSQFFLYLRSYILSRLKQDNIKTIMNDLDIPHEIDSYKNLALSQEEINSMLQSPLFTLGNHTHSHSVLNNLTQQEIKDDILCANKIITETFNIKAEHLALPFGGKNEIDQNHCNFIKTLDFKTIVTTRNGSIYAKHKDFLHVLPRIFLSNQTNIKNLIKIRKKIFVTY